RSDAQHALETGIGLAEQLIAEGADLIALGEMGIANTTSAAAIIADLTGQPPAAVTGFGTGIDQATWQRKVAIVERALARPGHGPDDPLGTLAQVGGFEIVALAGAMLGGAAAARPIRSEE